MKKTKYQLALQLTFIVGTTLFLVAAAYSQFLTLGVSGTTDGSGPVTPCTNVLDFTDACNSQYIVAVGF